jgi:integrase
MSKNQNLLSFKPAQLSIGKEWFVYYYALNPATDQLERKKIRLNRIASKTERRRYANTLIQEINNKLYSGWNPFLEESAPKGFTKMNDALESFYGNKVRELRKDSLRSYRSFIDTFKFWLQENDKSEMFTVSFNKTDAFSYLDWLIISKNVSNKTWNNYVNFMRSLFNWMKERQYVGYNPFEQIRKKSALQKDRIAIPSDIRMQILNHLEENDYNFLIVCMLVFHSLIRPKEICFLKPSCFSIENQTIVIPADASKNKKRRIATIPNPLVPYLQKWDFNIAQSDEYIFGTDIKPGKTPLDARRFTKKWDRLRNDLKLPSTMKLYSLRDSGIIQMLNDGISPEEIMKQADHSSLEMTTIYAKFNNPTGSDQIKRKGSGFSSNPDD